MIEVDGDNHIPICESCGHRHVLGVRCSICGHVGKSQIFSKMRTKASERRMIRFAHVKGPEIEKESQVCTQYQVILRLRRRISEQRSIPIDEDSEQSVDVAASHIICYVGDNPVAVGRWSLHQQTQTEFRLLIDNVMVTTERSSAYVAHKCLYNILLAVQQENVPLQCIDLFVPSVDSNQWVMQKLQSFGFVVMEHMSTRRGGVYLLCVRLVLACVQVPNAPSLGDLLGYFLGKLSTSL